MAYNQYETYLRAVDGGTPKSDRTGTGTKSIFGYQMRFDLQEGFPLVTTKKIHLKSIIHELLWILEGSGNNNDLLARGVTIWNEWAKPDGDLGPIYGVQWRRWPTGKSYNENYTLAELVAMYGRAVEQLRLPENEIDPRVIEKHAGLHEGMLFDQTSLNMQDFLIKYGDNLRMLGVPLVAQRNEEIDQIKEVIDTLRTNPDSRRIIVSAWNVGQLRQMSLQPCHAFFQFYSVELTLGQRLTAFRVQNGSAELPVDGDLTDATLARREEILTTALDKAGIPKRRLDLQLYQRSCDSFLGVPFNIASYALLLMMIAQQVDMLPGDFIWTGGDCHIYDNHTEQVALQLSRQPFPYPKMKIKRKPDSIFDYKYEDFEIVDYQCHAAIKAPVAV